ncbi:Ig-like domain-containing protein [Flavobacterium cyanobacteriorum]|nr:Ig-like domain-containing protein [Flavobacterium cyanobacteriorum]
MAGLSTNNTNADFNTIQYAWYLRADGVVEIFENGTSRGTFGSYNSSTIFRIAVEANVVRYYTNNTLRYTSNLAPTLPLLVDVSINSNGGTIKDVQVFNNNTFTFTAYAENVGDNPVYQWKVNGSNVGTNSLTYTNSGLQTGDEVTCEVLPSSSGCNAITYVSNKIKMTTSANPSVLPITGNTTICLNTTGTLSNATPGGIWASSNTAIATVTQTGEVSALQSGTATISYTVTNGSCSTSVFATVNVLNATPSVTIAANNNNICSGTSVTVTATATNIGGGTVTYNFKVNGSTVQSSASNTFTSTTLTNNSIITCDITITGGQCLTATTVSSNSLTIAVQSLNTPVVTIATAASTICQGSSTQFTATATNTGGGFVSYNFKVGGVSVQNGPSNTYTSTAFSNGNTVTCDITVTGGTCLAATTAVSNTVTLTVTPRVTPTVSIAANQTSVCIGNTVTVTATATNTGNGTITYNFKRNGASVQSGTSNTYTTSTITNGNIITCEITISGGSCLTGSFATSNTLTFSVINPTVVLTSSSSVVCSGENILFNASAANITGVGSVRYRYFVNDVLVQNLPTSTYNTSSLVPGDIVYVVMVVSGGQCLSSVSKTSNSIVISSGSVGGTVTGTTPRICANTTPGPLTLGGNIGSVLKWQSADNSAFTVNVADINVTTTTLQSAQIGALSSTKYFRAVVQNNTCGISFSQPYGVLIESTTWNGTQWSNGAPDANKSAIFTGNFTSSSNIEACSAQVTNGASVVISTGNTITLSGAITVDSGSLFRLQNAANLIQTSDVANSGAIVVERNSVPLKRLDYVLWSSPVAAQNLAAFSPLTSSNRFYTYNSATNNYASVASPASTAFDVAKGYLIRMPNTHPANTPTIFNGQFTGVPNNGNYSHPLFNGGEGLRYTLVGNPYPSPISAVTFAQQNAANITGTLYFWRKTNSSTNSAYCTWSPLGGGTGTFVSNGEDQVQNPLGVIQTGQGFIVEATASGSVVNFANSQRVPDTSNQFFRFSNDDESHRMWLNLRNQSGAFAQTMVGYFTGATMMHDEGMEGLLIQDGAVKLSSLINTNLYAIQARPVDNNQNDIVPLFYQAETGGNYEIELDNADGIFSTGSTPIYLLDKDLQIVTNLKESSYTFATGSGSFYQRFEIHLQNPLLSVNDINKNAAKLIVYIKDDILHINAGTELLDNVQLFDITGRLLYNTKGVNASEATINCTPYEHQTFIINASLSDGRKVSTKVIYN